MAWRESAGRVDDVSLLVEPFASMARKALARIVAEGLPLRVWETSRTHARQLAYYMRGRRVDRDGQWVDDNRSQIVTRAQPGESPHEWGLALDCVLDVEALEPGTHPWSQAPRHAHIWQRYGVIAHEVGLTSGWLDWGWDRPHIEMPGWTQYRPANWRDIVAVTLADQGGPSRP